tara:strand:+ start:227 stop:2206 length:1980 start_codon:yes stop_codon:yes gene_type:complete
MPRVPTTADVTNPHRKGYDFRLDNLLFRAAISPDRQLVIRSAEFPAQQIDLQQNPEDITTNIGQIFSRNDFSGGQGLDYAHKRSLTEKDTTRFFDSKGVDVFHSDDETSYNLHLLYTTEDKNVKGAGTTFAGSNNYLAQTTNGDLYVTDQAAIYKSTDNGATWNPVTTGLTINNNFTGAAAVGDQLYFTTATGTSAGELILFNGSSWSELSHDQTSNALTGVWFAKGQLFISGDDGSVAYLWAVNPIGKTWTSSDLAEADAIVTFEDSHTISQVVDAGAVVLAASTSGDIFSIKDVSGTMTLFGQTNIPFEEVHSIAAAEGIVFFGTKDKSQSVGRFYRADLVTADNLYVLANRQLVKEWVISGQDTTPKHMFVTRDSIYCGIKESGTESFLWRYYLPTAGFARDIKMEASGFITGITQANGKFVVVVAGADVYLESSLYESDGYVILPNVDFFTSEVKQWVGTTVEHDEITDSRRVQCFISTKEATIDNADSSDWELTNDSTTGFGGTEFQINRNARYLNLKVVLSANQDFTATPTFRSVSARALPRPQLIVVDIPVNISDQVERPNRKRITVKNLGEAVYQELKQKEGDSVTLELYDPSETVRGVVESVAYPVINNANIGSVTQYCTIRVRGVRAADVIQSSVNTLGIGTLGVVRLG